MFVQVSGLGCIDLGDQRSGVQISPVRPPETTQEALLAVLLTVSLRRLPPRGDVRRTGVLPGWMGMDLDAMHWG